MEQFRTDNTEGFSSAALAVLNTVFDRVMDRQENTDELDSDTLAEIEKSVADCITNEWQPRMSADRLDAALRSRGW